MFRPSLEEFKQKAKKGNLIPVYREILADMETPVSSFLKIDDGRHSFLLESVEGGENGPAILFLGAGLQSSSGPLAAGQRSYGTARKGRHLLSAIRSRS